MMTSHARAVTPLIEDKQGQGALRAQNQNSRKNVNNDSSDSDDKPNKRRKTNNKQAVLLNEFNQEFGDVESFFRSGGAQATRGQQEPISKVRSGLDSLFLPYHEARRLRIPEVLWIYSNPGFNDCPLDIPDHEDDEIELLPTRPSGRRFLTK
ncbi:hypothetical protein QTG54_009499 [Skeletonema marinoi]|uniref:Uncharacterized protein n=1 Tax=Skeletonema marinoi TaxID=267567 RepID=A0AAD9DBI8_9STRA|nr:hypothetical protein QTG54_009499 [Skeletonema marinoi]